MLSELRSRSPFRRAISLARRRDRLHVMATSAGYETACFPDYDWDGRKRGNTPFSVLQHTVAGSGNLRYERQEWRIRAGETMLVTIPHAHRYWVRKGESWSFFWIAMSGQEALRLHRAILKSAGPVFQLRAETIDALAGLALALQEDGLEAGCVSGIAYQATMAVYDDLLTRHAEAEGARAHPGLARVAAHVRDHLEGEIGVQAMADVAGMSRAHFSRLFARFEGMSPSEYVMQKRMELAAKLLSSGDLSVKHVSSACGFADPNYFAKVFRRNFSVSPSEFRTSGMYAAGSSRST